MSMSFAVFIEVDRVDSLPTQGEVRIYTTYPVSDLAKCAKWFSGILICHVAILPCSLIARQTSVFQEALVPFWASKKESAFSRSLANSSWIYKGVECEGHILGCHCWSSDHSHLHLHFGSIYYIHLHLLLSSQFPATPASSQPPYHLHQGA